MLSPGTKRVSPQQIFEPNIVGPLFGLSANTILFTTHPHLYRFSFKAPCIGNKWFQSLCMFLYKKQFTNIFLLRVNYEQYKEHTISNDYGNILNLILLYNL